jgi:hypothetical protein
MFEKVMIVVNVFNDVHGQSPVITSRFIVFHRANIYAKRDETSILVYCPYLTTAFAQNG